MQSKLLPTPVLTTRPLPGRAAVYIPAEEIAKRGFELPPPGDELFVVGDVDLGRPVEVISEEEIPPAEEGAVYRLWKPNPLLERIRRDPGDALDLGCGSGRDAVFLGAAGWRVRAIDHLPDALAMARQLQHRYAPDADIDWQLKDVHSFDEKGEWDLVTMFFYLHREAIHRLSKAIRPGGLFVCEAFTEENRRKNGKPASPTLALQPNELPTLLPGFKIIEHSEEWRGSRHTARLIAQAP